jgi:hypothetical protein
MASNICGKCANFNPKPKERFFNCTAAKQGGLKYGMQVRADTAACEAFRAIHAATPVGSVKRAEPARRAHRWLPIVLILVLLIFIVLLSSLLLMCLNGESTVVSPTPTATIIATPTATTIYPPASTPTAPKYYELGKWAYTSMRMATVSSAIRVDSYNSFSGVTKAPAGTKFVIMDVAIINIGNQRMYLPPSYFKLVDSESRSYAPSTYNALNALQAPSSIEAGRTASGKIIFVVPDTATGLEASCPLEGSPSILAKWKLQW